MPDVRALVPELPPGVQPVLERCLAEEPATRWPTADALAAPQQQTRSQDDTALLATSAFASATPPSPDDEEPPGNRCVRGLLAGCIALVLPAAVGGGVLRFRDGADSRAPFSRRQSARDAVLRGAGGTPS